MGRERTGEVIEVGGQLLRRRLRRRLEVVRLCRRDRLIRVVEDAARGYRRLRDVRAGGAGQAYLNVHTTMFPGGGMRGYLQQDP